MVVKPSNKYQIIRQGRNYIYYLIYSGARKGFPKILEHKEIRFVL